MGEGQLNSIADHLNRIEKNIELNTKDRILRDGFTQVPNFILEDPDIRIGAKVTYAMFLKYAWDNDMVFPGQDRLAGHIGMSVSRVNDFIKELAALDLIEVTRRGQGKTNLYKLNSIFRNKQGKKRSKS